MGFIAEKVNEHLTNQIRQSAVHSNRASQIGHECTRYLVYERTRWQEKPLYDVGLQKIFSAGNLYERDTIQLLTDSGFVIEQQQRDYHMKGENISAHIDGKIMLNGAFKPFEAKSMSPFVYASVNCLNDMKNHKYNHVRRYPAQLQIYLFLAESEEGVWILRDRNNYDLKDIEVTLDYEYAEALLQKAKEIEGHIAAETLPDRVDYDDEGCGKCPYIHICLPEADRKGIDLIDDPELIERIDRWFELKPDKKEFDDLDKIIKKAIKGKASAIVGGYHITGKMVQNKGYTKEVAPFEYWRPTIKPIT